MKRNLAFVCVVALLYMSCANLTNPTGGLQDVEPPQVVSFSPPNLSTQFAANRIELTFDEYVQLNSPSTTVVISPPLAELPEFSIKKKKLIIDLKGQTLEPNTTYNIQLGETVEDFNERNKAGSLNYVFSTGDALDSLKVKGRLFDSKTLKPIPQAKIMLYDESLDSALVRTRPDYFTLTEKDGSFEVGFLPQKSFQVIALLESNANFIYDAIGEESIAYSDSSTRANIDSLAPALDLAAFIEPKPLYINTFEDDSAGFVSIELSRPDSSLLVYPVEENLLVQQYRNSASDSLFVQLIGPEEKNYALVAYNTADSLVLDTIYTDFYIGNKAKISWVKKPMGAFHYKQPLEIEFNKAIEAVDASLIILKKDSIELTAETNFDGRKLQIMNAWEEDTKYNFTLLPNAILGYGGQQNDSLKHGFEAQASSAFGQVTIDLTTTRSDNMVLQLVDSQGKVVNDAKITGSAKTVWKLIKPSSYKLQLVIDTDNSGNWTNGNLANRQQPEKILLMTEEIAVRARWEQDVEWILE